MTAKADPLRRSLRAGVAITSLIGLGAGIYSYNDALFVAREAGTSGRPAYLVPLFADGLILLCSTALYAGTQASPAKRSAWATAGLIMGIAVTVVMNVFAGLAHSPADALIDAMAPVVFLIALEVLIWQFRLGRHGVFSSQVQPDGEPDLNADVLRLVERHSQRDVADWFGVSRGRVEYRIKAARTALQPLAETHPSGSAPDG